MDNIYPVVMGGGAGTRLWPLSRPFWPKQYLALGHSDRSLLQEAVARAKLLSPHRDPLLIVSEELRFVAQRQMAEAGIDARFIAEQTGRGTAAVAAAACLAVAEEDPAGLVVLMPSDHVVDDENALSLALRQAVAVAASGCLALVGVEPDRPETGYGYLRLGAPMEGLEGAVRVEEFVEKPSYEKAQQYQKEGGHLWNAGFHIFRAEQMLEQLERFSPQTLAAVRGAWEGRGSRSVPLLGGEAWEAAPDVSIDVAVLEKAAEVGAVAYTGGWSDLGGYEALWRHSDKDEQGNVTRGQVLAVDAENNYLHAPRRSLVALGVEGLAVVSDDDFVLVADRAHANQVPAVLRELRGRDWEDPDQPVRVHRPWGWYESLIHRPNYQLKRICLWPGQAISLQRHAKRSEHWVITAGEAELTLGEQTRRMLPNDYVFIEVGTIHRLRNIGGDPVEWVEVQTGTYFGEDDIERLDDIYGRAGS